MFWTLQLQATSVDSQRDWIQRPREQTQHPIVQYTHQHTQVTSREDCWSFHYFLLITVLQFLVFLSSVSIQLFLKKLNLNLLLLNNSKHFLLHQHKLCLILQNLLYMYYVLTCQIGTWCTAISKIIQNTVYLTSDMEMTHSYRCLLHQSQLF